MSASQQENERLLPAANKATPRPSLSDDDHLADDVEHPLEASQIEHDRKLLDEEEEREELLAGKKRRGRLRQLFAGEEVDANSPKTQKTRRKSRRDKLRGRGDEVSELMYQMEEAEDLSSSTDDLSRGSSEADEKTLQMIQSQKAARRKRLIRRFIIYGIAFILFLGLAFAAFRASKNSPKEPALIFSNGTANFAATTILISLDGFRADFLNRGLTPTLSAFVKEGVSPKYMMPSFPSLTFPNHYTLVTGLYPESHGIVGNTFWDPMFKEEFYYTHPAHSMQPKWWGGEPIWETAEKAGVATAIHMWPGSEANIGTIQPAYVDKYNGSERLSVKVNRILGLLDLPGPDMPAAHANRPRPQLIAAYVPNVDADGHKFGPNSTEIRSTIQEVDTMLHDLFHGLEQRNLTKIVNIVVVSDHGMATTATERLIQLDDLADPALFEHIDGWPLYGLRPKNPADLETIHQQLLDKTKNNPNVEVYLRDKDMPTRYHFANNDRIAPLWLIPKAGWAIVTKKEFDLQKALAENIVYHPRGLHGYDHEHPLMRAIFVARGPAFPHEPGSRLEPFQNIELYNIVCDSLGIEPRPNNGTVRLPLKPVGLHTDPEAPPSETPDDPPAASSVSPSTETNAASLASDQALSSSSIVIASPPTSSLPLIQTSNPATPLKTPTAHTDIPEPPPPQEGDPKNNPDFWKWFFDKWEQAKEWASEVFNKETPSDQNSPASPATGETA